MPENGEIQQKAGDGFSSAVNLSFGDAQQRRLRYHLLRLTVAGLTREDVEDLGELGRLAFQDSDIADQTRKIRERSGASPLAVAIADIVERAGSGLGPPRLPRAAMVGAVLGAYAAFGNFDSLDETLVATLGAVGGALAMSTNEFILDNIERASWSAYVRMEE